MTLVEAIKSGKRFRRPLMAGWTYFKNRDDRCSLSYDDLVATDWEIEIEEKSVTITRTQFLEAAQKTWADDFCMTRESPMHFAIQLAKRLGLE